jgi:hypothetical protein
VKRELIETPCPEPGCMGKIRFCMDKGTAEHSPPACAWFRRPDVDPLDVIKRVRETFTDLPDPNAN